MLSFDPEVVRALVASGKDLNVNGISRYTGMTPLVTMAMTHQPEAMKVLLDSSDEIDPSIQTPLLGAVQIGDVDVLRALITHPKTRRQAGVADADGKMPMEYAAEKCSYGMFSLFVKAMVGDI